MGLCINEDENQQGIGVEIRRESIVLGPTGAGDKDAFFCNHSDYHGWCVEVDKVYLKKLIEFFNENPKYLKVSGS